MSERTGENEQVVVSARVGHSPTVLSLPDGETLCLLRLMAARLIGESSLGGGRPGGNRASSGPLYALVLGTHARRIARHLYVGRAVTVHGRVQVATKEPRNGGARGAASLIAERVELQPARPAGRSLREQARQHERRMAMRAATGFSAEMWE